METRTDVDASAAPRGSDVVEPNFAAEAIALSDLLCEAERAVDAHPLFLRDTEHPARFTFPTDERRGWRVSLRARRLGTRGMKRRYREVDGVGPTPELAVANLVEGLDYLAEEMK